MHITIDIPQEFINHFEDDKFADSLKRLKSDAHCLAGEYEKELMDMLAEAFKKSRIEETKSELPMPPHPRWKPKQGYYYFCVEANSVSPVSFYYNDGDRTILLETNFDIGNVFRTEVEAEFVAERMKVLAKMQEWAGSYRDGFILTYDTCRNKMFCTPAGNTWVHGEMRFATETDAINCVKAV